MRILLFLAVFCISSEAVSWGQIGHRAVGHIAERYLNKKAQNKLRELLNGKPLDYVSTWMDDIKSDSLYDYAYDWHWVTVRDGMTYELEEKNPDGDIIGNIERIIKELETGGLSPAAEQEYVKMLVHLIGDIHQPLHVGTGEDQGGNKVRVQWFYDDSNLHRVWDSEMIQSKELSFTELAHFVLAGSDKEQIAQWQNSSVRDWAKESMDMREDVYDIPENKRLGYRYMYENWHHVERRILQAGVRLAAVLNKIYG